jgi:hypothetical protein
MQGTKDLLLHIYIFVFYVSLMILMGEGHVVGFRQL